MRTEIVTAEANPQRRAATAARRSYWLKTLHRWHWISSAVCLIALILFAATGITLNHAAQIKAKPQITKRHAILPVSVREQIITQAHSGGGGALPLALRGWLDTEWSLRPGRREAEWSDDEVYLSLPRPGGDAWLSITLSEGEIEYERTDRGWIAYFNDLHKARNTGLVWSAFVDVFAVACLVFAITGLFLLKLHAAQRGMTWPLVALGFVLPLLLMLLFIH
jgi:hypothetical protein